ncbi:cold shock domain-containing protein [Planomonospora sp. ID67723]|uniref:cold-shock protein n=1 Tax=Planomonospora sp. ID67723 TaxID=2738134 RepID=UPI0018C36DB0
MSSGLPAGRDAFAHFSEIVTTGRHELHPGDTVEFDVCERKQDGFDFIAVDVRTL